MRLYNFNDVVGNNNVVAVIRQSVINNTFPQIAIFSGVYGTGKSTCAEITALALTCSGQIQGNPCLTCVNCRNTLQALQTTAANERVIKINVGQKNTKADVDTMIREIFILKSSEEKVVYIIEEAHSLSSMQQTALLEELDKIPKGVHVIFCTTKVTKIIPELRNRAIEFDFKRITDNEAMTLLNNLSLKKSFQLDNEAKKIIIGHSKGIPRQLTNMFDFIASNQYKTTTIADFLGIVNEEEFILFFEAMKSSDMFTYVSFISDCIKAHSLPSFVEQLKEFTLKVVFLLEGNVVADFIPTDIERLSSIFSGLNLIKIATLIGQIPNDVSEIDFNFNMFKIKQLFNNKDLASVVKDKHINAVVQSNNAVKLNKEQENFDRVEMNKVSFAPLNMSFLNQFGGDV